jgi:hypothetical protein
MLGMAGEPSTNYELYESFKGSLPAYGFALLVGTCAAMAAGTMLDRFLKSLPYFNRATDGESQPIELTVWTVTTDEKNQEVEVALFSQSVPADRLDDILHDPTRKESLGIIGADGTSLGLSYPPSSPYEDEEENPLFASLRVTVKQRRRVLYSFETVLPGRYYAPEGKNYSTCVYALRHVGIEEESRARIVFKGPRSAMRDLFMS